MNIYVIEGIDGSGKSTAVSNLLKLVEELGYKKYFAFFSEPTNYKYGKMIRDLLKSKAKMEASKWVELFEKDRKDNLTKNILPNKDKIIILDRYYLSTAAYQANNKEEAISIFKYFHKKFPKPKMTFFIDIPISKALERIGRRGEEREVFEKEEVLRKVKENYEFLLREFPIEYVKINYNIEPCKIARIVLDSIF